MSKAVEIRDLWWRYPNHTGVFNPWALKGVNLTVDQGQFFALTGPSGAGKTTLCNCILGNYPYAVRVPREYLEEHFKGTVQVFGEYVTRVEKKPDGQAAFGGKGIMAPKVGLVMQDPENQFLRMSVLHEVALGLQILELDQAEIMARAREALAMVNLEHLWDVADLVHPTELSGGQKQRVALASFLAMRPELLILDEPTSDLDPIGKYEVIKAVRNLKEQYNLTVIMVEHSPEVIAEFADEVAVVAGGQVVRVGKPADIYAEVDYLSQVGVTVPEIGRIFRGCGIVSGEKIPLTEAEAAPVLIKELAGKAASVPFSLGPSLPPASAETVVAIQDLWHRYPDGTCSLKGVTAEIKRGEFIGLLGSNGSGKTTLSKIINGIYSPWKGDVQVLGQSVRDKRVKSKLARHVGYVFQNPEHQIFTRSVYDDVAYGLINMRLKQQEIKERVEKALAVVGLESLAKEDPLFLGKGQKQRLAVASILAMEPEILIVDEPTTGQDYLMSSNIMKLLEELNKKGTTIIVITHDMTLVVEFCKRILTLKNGQFVYDGSPRELFLDRVKLQDVMLYPPQTVRLTQEVKKELPELPDLLNTEEWISFYKNAAGKTAWRENAI